MEPVVRNIIQKLIDCRLVTNQQLVDGSTILAMGRQRNRFYYFKQLQGTSFFIKQAHEGEHGTAQSVGLEAQIYKLASETIELKELQSVLPKFFHYDAQASTLILELIKNAEDLGTQSRRLGVINAEHTKMMGVLTARYHGISVKMIEALELPFTYKPHWIFRLHEDPSPLPSLRQRSPASATFTDSILKDEALMKHLLRLREQWLNDALIHGDYKWENFLVVPPSKNMKGGTVKIIDWERADIGDRAWDIGCGLAAFVIHRVLVTGQKGQSLDADQFPLLEIVQEMRSFWLGYQNDCQLQDLELGAFVGKCVDMLSARLLVAAYENCYGTEKISVVCQCLLELAKRCAGSARGSIICNLIAAQEVTPP